MLPMTSQWPVSLTNQELRPHCLGSGDPGRTCQAEEQPVRRPWIGSPQGVRPSVGGHEAGHGEGSWGKVAVEATGCLFSSAQCQKRLDFQGKKRSLTNSMKIHG